MCLKIQCFFVDLRSFCETLLTAYSFTTFTPYPSFSLSPKKKRIISVTNTPTVAGQKKTPFRSFCFVEFCVKWSTTALAGITGQIIDIYARKGCGWYFLWGRLHQQQPPFYYGPRPADAINNVRTDSGRVVQVILQLSKGCGICPAKKNSLQRFFRRDRMLWTMEKVFEKGRQILFVILAKVVDLFQTCKQYHQIIL